MTSNRTEDAIVALKDGADPNIRFHEQDATGQGRQTSLRESAIRLVRGPQPMDFYRTDGITTPLIIAVRHQNVRIIRALLEHGAEVDAYDWSGDTALHVAVDGNVEVVQILLAHGANVNANAHGMTALLMAKEYKRTEMISLLTKAGGVCQVAERKK